MANLCGVNQKLVVEAIEKVRKGKWFIFIVVILGKCIKQGKSINTRIFDEMEKCAFIRTRFLYACMFLARRPIYIECFSIIGQFLLLNCHHHTRV